MKSGGASYFVLVLILSCVVGLNVKAVAADSRKIYVDVKYSGVENGTFQFPFDSIQEGIDNATAGDTVFVWNGTYYLNVSINLNKSLELEGENEHLTIIDGNQTDSQEPEDWIHGIDVTASNVAIKKFTIRKATPGIYLHSSNSSTIRDNIIITDLCHGEGDDRAPSYAVSLEYSSNNVVCNNNLTNNGFGIYLRDSSNCNNITGNLILSNALETNPPRYWDGIKIENSNHSQVINNTIGKLWDCGIGTGHACNNTFHGNTIADIYGRIDKCQQLGYGIVLYYQSQYNVVTSNNVSNVYPWGIDLYLDCDSNSVQYNSMTSSLRPGSCCLRVRTNCSGNNITFNSLANGSLGFYLDSCSGNSICRNNFVNNTAHVSSSSSNNSWNGTYPFGGNYWSGYNTNDTYKGPNQDLPGWDGINDTKYQIDQNNTDYHPTVNTWPLCKLKVEAWAIGDGKIETAGIWINGSEPHHNSTAYYLLQSGTWNVTAEASFTRQDLYDETKFYDYTFDHWEDNSENNPRTLTLSTDKNLIAYYDFDVWYISKGPPE